ncbi:hypothetical protein KBD49_07550 [Myxococcota bacterium]|nr:hypothetical protein [Myxococcota bacterium]
MALARDLGPEGAGTFIPRRGLWILGLWWLGLAILPHDVQAQGAADSQLPAALVPLIREQNGSPRDRWTLPLVGAFQEPWGFRLVFTLDPRQPEGKNLVEVQLHRLDRGGDFLARTPSFGLRYLGPTEGGRPAAPVLPLIEEVRDTVARNDPGGIDPAGALAGQEPAPAPGPRKGDWIDRVMVGIGALLVALFLGGLPFLLIRLWGEVRRLSPGWVLAVLAIGLAVRWILPHRPVMYYMGYWLVQAADSLQEIPKHGPAGLVFDHLLFWFTGPSHRVLSGSNAVLGSLIPLAGAGLLALSGAGTVAVRAAAALLALTPVFARDSTTESLLVPATLWCLLGLASWQRYRRDRAASDALFAFTGLMLAAFSRPEFLALVPMLLVFLPPPDPGPVGEAVAPGAGSRVARLLVAVSVPLLAFRVWHLQLAVGSEVSLGNLPVLKDPAALAVLAPDFLRRNLAFRPSWFPVGVTVLAFVGPLVPGNRRLALGLLLAALTGLAISLVDLPHVSLPRVQAPPLVFLALSASASLASLFGPVPRTRTRRALGLAAAGALALSTVFSTAVIRERTNADDEEDLWREVARTLPGEPVVLVRRGPEDQPVERLHLFHPDYWFRPPFREDLVINADRLPALDPAGRPVFFVLSTRCWLRECGRSGMHPACARVMEDFDLQPVFERDVPVRRVELDRKVRPDQDLDFPWCVGQSDGMRLGLYRVGSRRSSITSASSPSR